MEEQVQDKVSVTIFVNGVAVTFDMRKVTGLQIKTKAGLDPSSELYRKTGEKLTLIGNDELIEIHDKEEFVDFPPTPVS
jgi:hypothetical protein